MIQIKIDDVGLHVLQEGEDLSTINKVTGLVAGQFGEAISLVVIDDEGTVVDLSSYTSSVLKARSPDARTTLSFTVTLVGGGSSGEFTITPSSTNTFDRDGNWEGQAQFSDTGVLAITVPFEIEVEKKI